MKLELELRAIRRELKRLRELVQEGAGAYDDLIEDIEEGEDAD